MAETLRSLTGNEAAAWASRLARISVGLSFPMGPNAEVTEALQQFIDAGEAGDMKIIYGDNEKSVMSTQIGLARFGVRSMYCTTSEGMLWAMADGHYGAGSRLPMLIVCPSRALEPPTTVFCDHDDFIVWRDMGWLLFYCENAQDILDTILQAYKVIEHPQVMLPAVVGYDGWETSHASVPVLLPSQERVDAFLPTPNFIRPEKDYLGVNWRERGTHRRRPEGFSADVFMELKHHQKKSQQAALKIIEAVGREYQEAFGRGYGGLIETHECADAELILVTMGIVYPSVKFVVKALRKEGVKIGCVKLRVFRPFPGEALGEAVKKAKLVLTIDRNSIEALFHELRSALWPRGSAGEPLPRIMGGVLGVGGAPIRLEHIGHLVEKAMEAMSTGKVDADAYWYPLRSIDYDPTRDALAE